MQRPTVPERWGIKACLALADASVMPNVHRIEACEQGRMSRSRSRHNIKHGSEVLATVVGRNRAASNSLGPVSMAPCIHQHQSRMLETSSRGINQRLYDRLVRGWGEIEGEWHMNPVECVWNSSFWFLKDRRSLLVCICTTGEETSRCMISHSRNGRKILDGHGTIPMEADVRL